MGTGLTIEQALEQVNGWLTRLENEVIQLRNKNAWKDEQIDKLKEQLAATGQGPSTTTGNESFMATLKAFFEQNESKVRIPKLHDWEGDRKGFKTFQRECETWLKDRKVQDEQKAVVLIAGYMKGRPPNGIP